MACISPYNFPTTNAVGKAAPALAVGYTVVLKPAPQDPLCVIELARIFHDAGFPPGVVNIVTGAKPEVGAVLVEDPNVDMVSFTGSTPVGIKIMEAGARTMKRQLQELGGKGACVVTDDADLDMAVEGIASVWAFHSGQICTAPTRVIVHRSRYDELVGRLATAARALKVGDPLDAATQVGPVISGIQRDRILDHIEIGMKEGAELVVDGRDPGMDTGFYVGPHAARRMRQRHESRCARRSSVPSWSSSPSTTTTTPCASPTTATSASTATSTAATRPGRS